MNWSANCVKRVGLVGGLVPVWRRAASHAEWIITHCMIDDINDITTSLLTYRRLFDLHVDLACVSWTANCVKRVGLVGGLSVSLATDRKSFVEWIITLQVDENH